MNHDQQAPENDPAPTQPAGYGAMRAREMGRRTLSALFKVIGILAAMSMWHSVHAGEMAEAPPALAISLFCLGIGAAISNGMLSGFKSPGFAYVALFLSFVAAVDLSGDIGASIWGNAPFTLKEWSGTIFAVSLAVLVFGAWLRHEALTANPDLPHTDFSKIFAWILVVMSGYALYRAWDASGTGHDSVAVHDVTDAVFLIALGIAMLKQGFGKLPSAWQFYPALLLFWFAWADAVDIADVLLQGSAPLNPTKAWLLMLLLCAGALFLAYALKKLAANRTQLAAG